MFWFFFGHIFSILLSLIRVSRLSENDKDSEIIILQHQLDVMVRKQKKAHQPQSRGKSNLGIVDSPTEAKHQAHHTPAG